MAFDPISSRITVEDSTEVGPTARQIPVRVQKGEPLTEMKVCRPQRFNNKGQLTAVAGVPIPGHQAIAGSEAYAEGDVSEFSHGVGSLAEADGDTSGLSGQDLHVAQMLADGVEGAESYW